MAFILHLNIWRVQTYSIFQCWYSPPSTACTASCVGGAISEFCSKKFLNYTSSTFPTGCKCQVVLVPGCWGSWALNWAPLKSPHWLHVGAFRAGLLLGGGGKTLSFAGSVTAEHKGPPSPTEPFQEGEASWTWNGSKGKEIPCTETAKLSEMFTYPKSSSKVPESWKEWRLVMFSWWNCMLSLSGLLVLSSDLWYIFMVLDTFFIMIRLSYHETIRNCEDVSLRERPFQY